jgi:hypothetical protein
MLPIIQVSKSRTERGSMPQFDDVLAFLKFCQLQGLRYRKVTKQPDNLKPRQNDINLTIVFKIIASGLDTNKHPLLVAKDNEILDGHHRWYSGKVQRTKVNCYQIQASEQVLLRLAAIYGAKHESIKG